MVNYLTPEGLAKLKRELYHLRMTKRKEIAARLKHAASFGDLAENAAYQEAKEAQGFLEGRVSELKKIIANAQLIKKGKTGRVEIGSIVTLFSAGEKEGFQIVDPKEVDIVKKKISYQSPLGKALLGKTVGAEISVENSQSGMKYKILKID